MKFQYALLAVTLAAGPAFAQGGRGGIPNATPEQTAAVTRINGDLGPQNRAIASARAELLALSLTIPRNDTAIKAKVDALRAAELALANARADAFAALQSSPDKLGPEQVRAFASMGGSGRGGGAPRPADGIPNVTNAQMAELTRMTSALAPMTQSIQIARTDLANASVATPRNDASIKEKLNAVIAADLALANARADAMAKIQMSPGRLNSDQIAALISLGGGVGQMGFVEPQPMDFNDHKGYVSLFDGASLKGWDGNPKFWRVEDGAIVGESTPTESQRQQLHRLSRTSRPRISL